MILPLQEKGPVAKATAKKENVVIRYLKKTRAELKKVNWPSRQEATNLTLIVIAVTTFMALLLGLIDYLFSKLFELILG
ncbi:MAG: preprotein translocase subunit SecE [Anaerolineales bacterium]|jgi:preprotein translocase subunit SecE|nr:MAG: preprotein translocase subunit SecE [Anaerolineales bacterium]